MDEFTFKRLQKEKMKKIIENNPLLPPTSEPHFITEEEGQKLLQELKDSGKGGLVFETKATLIQ